MTNKFINNLVIFLLALAFLIFLILFFTQLHGLDFYSVKKIVSQTNDNSLISNINTDRQIANLLDYLNGQNKLNNDFYTSKEQSHLVDVLNLIIYLKFADFFILILLLTVFGLIFYLKGKNYFWKLILKTAFYSLMIEAIILLILFLNFNGLFTWFHLISFNNDFWLLDPARDRLIIIFPPAFFYVMTAKIFISTIFFTIILALSSWLILKISQKSD